MLIGKKENTLQISSQIDKTVELLEWIPNANCEHQCICNILKMLTYLMMSKLIYLHMDWENIQLIDEIKTDQRGYLIPQISTIEFFWKNSNINLNTLPTIAKSFICDAWLCPEYASEGEYNRTFKIQAQAEISLWQHVKMESLCFYICFYKTHMLL